MESIKLQSNSSNSTFIKLGETSSFIAVYNALVKQDFGCLHAPTTCSVQDALVWTFLTLAFATLIVHSSGRLLNRRNRLPRPPGSNGWPVIGETWQFYVEDGAEFVRKRVKKYGKIFHTHILGHCHLIVHTNDFVKYVLDDPRKIFGIGLPSNVVQLYRNGSIAVSDGKIHDVMSFELVKSLSPKHHETWLSEFNKIIRSAVDSWKGKTINCGEDSRKLFIDTGLIYIFGVVNKDKELRKWIMENIHILGQGLLCFPVNLPGTGFRKALQARKNLDDVTLQFRQKHLEMRQGGIKPSFYSLMDYLVDYRDSERNELTPDMVCNRLANVVHGQFETMAIIFTWFMKFLSENPEVLRLVKEENDAIRNSKDGNEYELTEEDLEKMTYSWQVIQETLRLASVVGTTVRKARTDFEYEGFSIPKSWTIQVVYRSLHYNPENFPEPTKFDPSRFENPANLKPNSYLPFGTGYRVCRGKKIARMNLLVTLHYVSTKLRWTCLDANAGVVYVPLTHVKGGYPIKVHSD
ncbi:hypothetical protein Mapa_008322 [Marchantia paleacea]|nr:hypothetical protein Mapa_008322 [Marchantia paleacea]